MLQLHEFDSDGIAIRMMVASVATALTLASASTLTDNNESGRKAAWKIFNKNTLGQWRMEGVKGVI